MKPVYALLMFMLLSGALAAQPASGDATIYEHYEVEEEPRFPGDEVAFYLYIQENLLMNSARQDCKFITDFVLEFIIEADGTIQSVPTMQKNEDCTQNLIQVVQQMPRWKPALQDGVPVRCRMKFPLHIRWK
jgi:periplasmic protein TonB